MCTDYDLKKIFLETFFKEIIGSNPTEKKNIMLDNYILGTLNTEKGDGCDSIFNLGIRDNDSAICLFDREMMGSDEADSINVFDDHPYFEIVPDSEKEGGYYYKYSDRKHYKFAVGEQLCTAISFLLNRFVKKYREHYKK